jgi:hypothetical protein
MSEELNAETSKSKKLEREIISFSRKTLIKAILIGAGLSTILSACGGLTQEEKENIPEVPISDLIDHPDHYMNLPYVKTVGYPEKIGEEEVSFFGLQPFVETGEQRIYLGDETIIRTEIAYELHETEDRNSPSIQFNVDDNTLYFPFIPQEPPKGLDLVSAKKYQVIGEVKKVRDGESEKFVLEQKSIDKADTAVPVK